MTRRFLVVDDHPVFRHGLVTLIHSQSGYQVVAEAGSSKEALSALEKITPDIALVDITLKNDNGLDLVRIMKKTHPDVPVLIVTMHDEIVYAERSMKAGARGLVMKQEAPETILKAIKTVLSGRVYLSDRMNERLIESMFAATKDGESSPVDRLSERETEVLEFIGQGFGATEIAQNLALSVKTVNTYQEHLKEKLNMESSADVRRFAVSWFQATHR